MSRTYTCQNNLSDYNLNIPKLLLLILQYQRFLSKVTATQNSVCKFDICNTVQFSNMKRKLCYAFNYTKLISYTLNLVWYFYIHVYDAFAYMQVIVHVNNLAHLLFLKNM